MKISFLGVGIASALLFSLPQAHADISVKGKGGVLTKPDGTKVICPDIHYAQCAVISPTRVGDPGTGPLVVGESYYVTLSDGSETETLTLVSVEDPENENPNGSDLVFEVID